MHLHHTYLSIHLIDTRMYNIHKSRNWKRRSRWNTQVFKINLCCFEVLVQIHLFWQFILMTLSHGTTKERTHVITLPNEVHIVNGGYTPIFPITFLIISGLLCQFWVRSDYLVFLLYAVADKQLLLGVEVASFAIFFDKYLCSIVNILQFSSQKTSKITCQHLRILCTLD